MFKAIIFDVDGTLSETEEIHRKAFNRAFNLKGIDKLTCRRGLALQDRGLNAQYVDAGAHCGHIFKSRYA